MCGRFLLDEDTKTIIDYYKLEMNEKAYESGVKFPGTEVLVITDALQTMNWGIYLSFYKHDVINSRIEKIEEKGYFYEDFKYRRCLVPATAFYEWDKKSKEKYFVTYEESLFSLAGIYRIDDKQRISVSLLTTTAGNSMETIHSREPIILSHEEKDDYLYETNVNKLISNLRLPKEVYLKRLEPKQESFL